MNSIATSTIPDTGFVTPAPSTQEASEEYRYVVKRFDDRWRLIVGRVTREDDDPMQWILQERRGTQWHGKKYFARAAHVPTSVRQLVGESAYRWAAEWAARPHLKHT